MIEIKDCLPEGWTILYSAAWQGNPTDVFTARPEAPESRSMGLSHTQLMSVSSLAELAVLLDSKAIGTWVNMGTLARAPLAGSGRSPRFANRATHSLEGAHAIRPSGGGEISAQSC